MKYEDELDVLKLSGGGYDENGYPIEEIETWVEFGKCFISFNSAAQTIVLNDGNEYIYSYYIIAPLNKEKYDHIPREGDKVRIRKADGTINREMEVKGFVTYKKRFLKVWL